MGIVKDIVAAPVNIAKNVVNTVTGKPAGKEAKAYNPVDSAFVNPETKRLLSESKDLFGQELFDKTQAQQNQLEVRKQQLETAERFGLISREQADVERMALAEQESILNQQAQNIAALTQQAEGTGPSLSQNFLQDATDRNIKQTIGSVVSQRGVPAGQAMRTIANVAGNLNQEAASEAANLRLKEQMEARNALTSALSQVRGQSAQMGQSATGARLGATEGESNIEANVRGQDLNQKQMAQQGGQFQQEFQSGVSERDRQAQMGKESLKAGQSLATQELNQQRAEGAAKRSSDFISNIGGAVIGAISDSNNKKNIKNAKSEINDFLDVIEKLDLKEQPIVQKEIKVVTNNKDINDFLDAIEAHSYEYKNKIKDLPIAGDGLFFSPMAQEIEKTDVGKSMVKDTPIGKVVDYAKAGGVTLSSLSVLNDRLKKIEKELGLEDEN